MDWVRYRYEYADLSALSLEQLESHWKTMGVHEGRKVYPLLNDPSRPTAQVISIGTWCQTTIMLAHRGLSAQAYPFDWIRGPIDSVLLALSDRLQHLYVESEIPDWVKLLPPSFQCATVENRYHQLLPHLFDHSRSPAEQITEVTAKMTRRVERFLSLQGHVIFVFFQDAHWDPVTVEQVEQLVSFLRTILSPSLTFKVSALLHHPTRRGRIEGDGYLLQYGKYPVSPHSIPEVTHDFSLLLDAVANRMGVSLPYGKLRKIFG